MMFWGRNLQAVLSWAFAEKAPEDLDGLGETWLRGLIVFSGIAHE
jgi:hypothetical protein